jgi:hypothetical protein
LDNGCMVPIEVLALEVENATTFWPVNSSVSSIPSESSAKSSATRHI